jgi:hypothetical protein
MLGSRLKPATLPEMGAIPTMTQRKTPPGKGGVEITKVEVGSNVLQHPTGGLQAD